MYELVAYDLMLADAVRTEAHLAAIAAAVKPGDVVVEIGTGVGYFAVAAVRAGARRVYAIETNPAVTLGPAVAAANGCADRVSFIHGNSMQVVLPERGDVLLADLRGMLPLAGEGILAIIDARERHLRPGATLIPVRDTLFAAPAALGPDQSGHRLALGPRAHGICRGPVDRASRSFLTRVRVGADQLLAPAAEWASIDFASVHSPDVTGELAWTVERAGGAQGICVWFDTNLGHGATISNAPGQPTTAYGHGIFPFQRRLDVEAGDTIRVAMRAKLMDGDYIFAWDTTLEPCNVGRERVAFRQSMLDALLLRPEQLTRRRADHRPHLSAQSSAKALADLIALADGTRTLTEVATALRARHPTRFASERDALRYATERASVLEDEGDMTGWPSR